MPFQLNIRHNLRATEDLFGPSEVRSFTQAVVRVGRGEECECRIHAGELEAVHFDLLTGEGTDRVVLCPRPDTELFLNADPVAKQVDLHSGDEIRVGHWTFRFQRLRPRCRHGRRSGLLATVAKVLVAAILVGEVAMVVWLPQRLSSARLWEGQIARQRTTFLLDVLRARNNRAEVDDDLSHAARQVLRNEFSRLIRYVRSNEETLTRQQWDAILRDLRGYEKIMNDLTEGTAFSPLPEADVDGAVRRALGTALTDEANDE